MTGRGCLQRMPGACTERMKEGRDGRSERGEEGFGCRLGRKHSTNTGEAISGD